MTPTTPEDIFRAIEPYLKCGLSLHKASLQAEIPKSTVYDLYSQSAPFSEKVELAKNYHAILVTDILTKELEGISSRQKQGKALKTEELRFTQWVALNSHSLKQEFGDNIEVDEKMARADSVVGALSKIIARFSGPDSNSENN